MKTTKKTLTFAFALAALLCLLVLSAGAYNGTRYEDTGIYYSISNGDAVITDARSDIETADIPESIGKYTVTGIEGFAFKECTALTSVTIPKSVTRIGSSAFISCTSLSSITIPENVTSIGDYAFRDCSALNKINWNAESVRDFSQYNVVFSNAGTSGDGIDVVFGDNVRSIPAYLFYGAGSPPYKSPKIKTITLGNNVTSIGISAFRNCNAFSNITIPNSVTSIGNCVFDGCIGLTSITIGRSVTEIGDYAFSECTGLTSVAISDSATSIGRDAFWECSGLTSVTIGNSVTSIGDGAFCGCSGLKSITIPDSVTSINSSAFSGCAGLKSTTIGNSVTSIGEHAFWGCTGLTGITIPDSVTSIGSWAFYNCTGLTSITIPNSVTSIGKYAFGYYFDEEDYGIDGFVVKGFRNTAAETYANENGFKFVALGEEHTHKYIGTVTKKATCTENGTKTFTCNCGKSYTKVIPATGHKYKTTTTKATTSKNGKAVTACTVCKKISKATVIYKASSVKLSKTSYTYNGKAQKPKVAVKNSKGKALTEGKDYTVKYQSGRKNPGCCSVTVTFKGNYSGKKTLTFTIAPKAPTLKVKAGTKKATLSWNKQTGATGYNVYMATSKNGKYKKLSTVKVGSKTSYTAAKLTKGKTVYFKVTAYTVSGRTTVNSAYSKAVGAKIK